MANFFKLEELPGPIAVLTFDTPDKKVNTLSRAVLEELGQHVAALDLGRAEVGGSRRVVVLEVIEGSCPGQAEEDCEGKNGSHGVAFDFEPLLAEVPP